MGAFINKRAAIRAVLVPDASFVSPLLKVEEDGVETEEEERDGSAEPAERVVAESVGVDPNADLRPTLRLAEWVCWVRASDEDGEYAGDCSEGGGVSLGVVETDLLNEELEHHWVDQACNAGARRDHADSEALLFPEPSGNDWKRVSGGEPYINDFRYNIPCELVTKKQAIPRPVTAP